MKRVNSKGAVSSRPIDLGGETSPGYFSDGNIELGDEGTRIDASWLNSVQEEIISVITKSGIDLDNSKYDQLYQAINKLINDKDVSNQNGIEYGTCSTSASVAAKVSSISNFVLKVGATVGIRFSAANTADNPTLNISSSGAFPIYAYNKTLTSTDGFIAELMTALFQFNGSQWVLLNPAGTEQKDIEIGTSTTSYSTVAKVGTLSGFVRKTGGFVGITFTNPNTAKNPTLNINSTGAAPITIRGQAVSPGQMPHGVPVIFRFDGTNYEMVSPENSGIATGTSETAAGTAIKQVIVSEFSAKPGSIVGIIFTETNTASSPRLAINVGGTSGVSVTAYINLDGVRLPSTHNGRLEAGKLLLFQYDGEVFHLLNSVTESTVESAIARRMAVCTTSVSAINKTATLAGFVKNTGSIVVIKFNNANTAANATLNVGSTGASVIQVNGANLTATDNYITAGMYAIFQFDGEFWQLLNPNRINYGTADLTPGTSALATGSLYFVYE